MDDFPKKLKALADETRYRMVNLLLTYDYCVGALAARLGVSEAATSQHLQILRRSGLVKGEKRGYWTHYAVQRDVLRQIADQLQTMAAQSVRQGCICPRDSSAPEVNVEGRNKGMCKCECKCQHPERLKAKPGECSPEQVKECHGNTKEHPCEEEEK